MPQEQIDQKGLDRILIGDAPLRNLKKYFPTNEAAYRFFAQRMVQAYPADRPSGECEGCQRHGADLHVALSWRGIYHTANSAALSTFGAILAIAMVHHISHLFMPSKEIDFSTTHGFCEDCFSQLKGRRRIAHFLKYLCLILIVLAALIFASTVVFIILFLFPNPTMIAIWSLVIALLFGFVCLFAGLTWKDQAVRWCIPTSLRRISKSPFELIGIERR